MNRVEIFLNILIFVMGAMMGSAANALIDRLPRRESWFKGRSHCDRCGHTLEIIDLIPIISYVSLLPMWKIPNSKHEKKKLWYQAGCRYCEAAIPFRNTLVEIFMGIGFVVLSTKYEGLILYSILLMGILWVTTIIAVMDWETKLVSEVMVGIWAVLVVILNISNLGNLSNLGGLVVAVIVIGGLWAISKGKAMGFGDVEIAAVMGFWLGWPAIAPALWVAFVTGAIAGSIQLIANRKTLKSQIAFGPFLVLAAWVGYFIGDKILIWSGLMF